ncbi:MAG: elongation factor EF-2 [Candidatus Aenigmarchaeota archaeon]|nr:elongation factor EF-2 [Candidatus Aenigmarchaeota archaeon]
MAKIDLTEKIKELMYKPQNIRNIGTIAHIDHGKTTFSDNLLARAGMISEDLAGRQLYLDFTEQEQERGITIWAANASMVHEYEGDYYLVNLIDTPGHVDFGGDVTRAMRAVDGAILIVCAVEGVMPQTETVLRQSLRERVKPVLFINKVDRLIKELKLTPQQMQERFKKIIDEVNFLIQKYAEPQFKTKWLVNVEDGSVAFGSALHNWAISVPFMKKTGITFNEIIEHIQKDEVEELAKKAPLHEVVLDMIVKHLPSPKEAQPYRIPKIWKGDIESEVAKDMMDVNPKGKLAAVVTKMIPDPHAGFVATVRIFSGKISKGQVVYLVGQHKEQRVQQVSIYKGPRRIPVDEVTAGNIAGVVGLTDAFAGETVCQPDHIIAPFEEIRHLFEPVVTKAIEPKNPKDLTKLINFLKKLAREDTTIKVKINEETGEYLVSGLGELHIEAKVERVLKEQGLDIITSEPIVVYRETVEKQSPVIEGKSPNKHNKFYFVVEPLEKSVLDAMNNDVIPDNIEVKRKNLELQKLLVDNGMSSEDAKGVILIYNKNVLIDATKGVQYLNEVIEMVKEGFRNVMDEGPLAKEPCVGVKVKLVDAELHEDPVHRGPGQVLPAVRYAIRTGMLKGDATLLEPKQIIRIDVPMESMGSALKLVQNRRGQILEIKEERGASIIIAKVPVSEMFGFNSALKSATEGKGFYSLIDVVFEKLPKELRDPTILKIRKRKGMKEEIPTIEGEE